MIKLSLPIYKQLTRQDNTPTPTPTFFFFPDYYYYRIETQIGTWHIGDFKMKMVIEVINRLKWGQKWM